MREVVIVDSVRTGLAKSFRGKFNMTRPDDMAAHCVDALLARTGIDPASVEDCIVGAGSNEGAQGYNIGRNVAVLSRLGIGCAGMTLNRFCSSGLQAIAIAANQIASGCSDIIVAGGVESISLTMKSVNTDNLINPLLKEQTPGIYFPMGQTAEIVARRYHVSREEQDLYALQSQQRTAQAQAAGLFDDQRPQGLDAALRRVFGISRFRQERANRGPVVQLHHQEPRLPGTGGAAVEHQVHAQVRRRRGGDGQAGLLHPHLVRSETLARSVQHHQQANPRFGPEEPG